MNELERRKGFEAGIAFALRHGCIDISRLVADLSVLRTWKSPEEWQEFVEKNVLKEVTDA